MNIRSIKNISNSIGKKYGRLLVIESNGVINHESSVICKCECGHIKPYFLDKLKTNHVKSCGCFNIESSSKRIKKIALNNKGSKHYLYNPNKTMDERLKKRKIWINERWRNAVFERDGYCCRITGKAGKLNVHHLNSFYLYTEERYSLNNGITLLEEIHKLFHKYYGRITTREQFIEFINKFNKKEIKCIS